MDAEIFDAYAQAALTGLLANSAVTTALGIQASLNNQEDQLPRTLIEASMGYAVVAVKVRRVVLARNQSLEDCL